MPEQPPPPTGPTCVVTVRHSVSGPGSVHRTCWATGAEAVHYRTEQRLPDDSWYEPCTHLPRKAKR